MKLQKSFSLSLLSLALFAPSLLTALPSGLAPVPSGIKIPIMKNGRALPVALYKDSRASHSYYVKPLEAVFTDEVNKYVGTTNCNAVKAATKEVELVANRRLALIDKITELEAALPPDLGNQIDARVLLEKLQELDRAFTADLSGLAEDLNSLNDAIDAIRKDRRDLESKLEDAEDEDSKADILAEIQSLKEAKQAKEAQRVTIEDEITRIKKDQRKVRKDLADLKGGNSGVINAWQEIRAELDKKRESLSKIEADINERLTGFSHDLGGYTRVTIQLAPSEYIRALEIANPKTSFQYIPTSGGAWDITFPAAVKNKDGLLELIRGRMIRDQKWDNAEMTRGKGEYYKLAMGAKLSPDMDASKLLEGLRNHSSEFTDDLEGTKSLSLELTSLGYCALTQPESIVGAGNTANGKQVFGLSYFYSYPVKYDIQVTGRLHRSKMLYERLYRKSSSSWLGLRKQEKQEFIRNVSNNEYVDIRVTSSSPDFMQSDASALRDKVAEQLSFMLMRDHLKLSTEVPANQFSDLNAASGASKVAARLLLWKNPYAMATGVILGGLDTLFGGKSQEQIASMTQSDVMNINYRDEFVVPHVGGASVGDLKINGILLD